MRSRVELTLRAAGLVALALWIALAARPRVGRTDAARVAALDDALPRWTRSDPVGSVRVHIDSAPDHASAAWLAALSHAGVGVSWSGDVKPVALETYPANDPAGGVFVLTRASAGVSRVVADELGPIDTLAGTDVALRLTSVNGRVTVRGVRQVARADVAKSPPPRRVFVTGAAGWEAKFVIVALEESGWQVDARIVVGPGHDVWQGSGARAGLDTSRYAAVVLLDSAAAEDARGVEPFVRAGGGVVLSGDANRAGRVAALLGWRLARREVAPLGTLPGDTAWRGQSRVPLRSVTDRPAIVLERRDGNATVAVRRHYAGRVAAVGYDQTWRWRMAGGESSPAAHREWWSRLVAGVALRPVILSESVIPSASPVIPSATRDLQFGSAPLAELYAALGTPSETRVVVPPWWTSRAFANLLGAIALASLLAEWLFRRSRGGR